MMPVSNSLPLAPAEGVYCCSSGCDLISSLSDGRWPGVDILTLFLLCVVNSSRLKVHFIASQRAVGVTVSALVNVSNKDTVE